MSRVAFRNFTGGEVTPTLTARYDLKKFGSFLQCCRNFIPNLHGDIERRPGTRFVADLGAESVLMPFQFNTDPENNYVIIFQEGRILIGATSGLISGVELTNPYTLSDVYDISYAQVADVVYLAHTGYPLHKLYRSGSYPSYEWTIEEVVLNKSIAAPGRPTVTWHRGPKNDDSDESYTKNETYDLSYKISAVDDDGIESLPSSAGSVTARYPTDWVSGDYAQITWSAVSGAVEYNIYRDSAGYYGLIGISETTSFKDENFEADTATTPKEDWNPFEDGNNPSVVCFHQQRMMLGGTPDSPGSFYASRTGDFENFRKSRPVQDDDPIEYMLASGSIDDIKWMCSFGDLLIGTSGAEYEATSNGSSITPSDVNITSQSYWGSASIRPLIIGTSIMHCQRAGSHVRDLAYSWEQDGYDGNDLSILAPQLVEGYRLRQWCFQQTPGENVWIVRNDGALLCLTYMKEQQVYGWSRHLTDGKVTSVAGICGDQEDIVMFVVQRTINGETKYFLEQLATRFGDTDELEDAWYVDCGITQTFEESVTEVGGLSHLEGKEVVVLADGAPEEDHVVQNGAIQLNFPAKHVLVGLNYESVLVPLPLESDAEQGTTMDKRRAYGKTILRLYRSVGGKWYGTKEGDIYDTEAWREKTFFEFPVLPEVYGAAVPTFSGDRDLSLPSGQDPDSSIIIVQDRPLPFRLVAIMTDVEFGEM